MTLRPGARLGPYEITGAMPQGGFAFGAGGMGEVFRARDTRLAGLSAFMTLSRDSTGTAPAQEIRIVLNWVNELKRPVPVK
jgi:hypothetical protein